MNSVNCNGRNSMTSGNSRPIISPIIGIFIVASTLSGCAIGVPGVSSPNTGVTTASTSPQPRNSFALGAPPAAYPQRHEAASSRPYIRRTTAGTSTYANAPIRRRWQWSEPRRGSKVITVRRGQSLSRIAIDRRVAISELMAANRLRGPSIEPGQQLLVPLKRYERAAVRPARAPRALTQYDNRGYTKPSRLFERSNEPLPRTRLSARGYQTAAAARRPLTAYAGRSYQVRAGDTLYAISRRTGISPKRLARHNALINPSNLPVGMVLSIPR